MIVDFFRLRGLSVTMYFRLSSVVALVVGALLFVAGCGKSEPSGSSPDSPHQSAGGEVFLPAAGTPVIILDIDTLRADHLGCYGYGRDTSPNIDAMSGEGVRFEWVFSQAPNTPPSQASILTSLYPSTHGRIRDEEVLPDSVVTLAELFQQAGYATGAFVDGGLMAGEFGLGQGFDVYDDEAGGLAKIDGKVRAWIRAHRDEPFLLFAHTYDVHSPYEETPEPFRSRYMEGLEEPSEDFREHMTWRMEQRRQSQYSENPLRLSTAEVEYARAMYDGGIREMDTWFGRFMEFLRQEGLYDRAILVLISDHGDAFEEHNTVFHERLYSPVTRIPMVIRFPGGKVRRVVTNAVEAIDLMPTLLASVGLEIPEALQGQSLLPLLNNAGQYRELAVSESPFFGRRVALTTSEYRLFYTERGKPSELYAYRQDPLEQIDLAAEYPDVVEQLERGVEGWEELATTQRHAAAVARMKDSTIEQLKALGYL
jgi:arylsulfatase A-like enzyme